jgi:quinol monooxygenase YgiN
MKFVQIIEFKTDRLEEFNAVLDAALAKPEARTPHRVVHTKDRDTEDWYALILEFPSEEKAMENSNRPEVAAFAASLAKICDGPLTFRNLDLLREEDA